MAIDGELKKNLWPEPVSTDGMMQSLSTSLRLTYLKREEIRWNIRDIPVFENLDNFTFTP